MDISFYGEQQYEDKALFILSDQFIVDMQRMFSHRPR
jgi:hypothetical protein